MSRKVLVVHSGGMDSTAALYWARQTYEEVETVSVFYGQRHSVELQYASDLVHDLGIHCNYVPMSAAGKMLGGSALTDINIPVPEGHYADETMKATVVPNRNMILLSIACGIAIARNAEKVIIGVHAGDHPIYPDCRPEFIESFNQTVRLGTQGFSALRFEVLAPFFAKSKADIAALGDELEVPWERTWSCYNGLSKHCGKCGTCVERKEAFELAGVVDPTVYAA